MTSCLLNHFDNTQPNAVTFCEAPATHVKTVARKGRTVRIPCCDKAAGGVGVTRNLVAS